MITKVIYPQNDFLKRFVKYFLFQKNTDPNYNKKHISYPNTNHCIGLFKGSRLVQITDYLYNVEPFEGYHSYLTGLYDKPVSFSFKGEFDEICIDFEPLGIEMLTGYKISHLKFINHIIEEVFDKLWSDIYPSVFSTLNLEDRARTLERFLLKKMVATPKFEFINFNEMVTHRVEDLKEFYNLSYRSIHRLYRQNLGVSPKTFLDMTRFRKSVSDLNVSTSHSQLAYSYKYSDQSHFIRSFRQYTDLTPKQFLNQVKSIDNEVWLYKE